MSDTQWNRYQVFVQESEGKPHLDYGSVHAPDPELALLNARDVFARRPDCVSMWIVPAEAIHVLTAENLRDRVTIRPPDPDSIEESYYIFVKQRQTGMMTFDRKIHARSPDEALEKALAGSEDKQSALVWWTFPAGKVYQSDMSEVDSDFAPAREKTFRLSNDFHTLSDMRKIKHTAGGNPE